MGSRPGFGKIRSCRSHRCTATNHIYVLYVCTDCHLQKKLRTTGHFAYSWLTPASSGKDKDPRNSHEKTSASKRAQTRGTNTVTLRPRRGTQKKKGHQKKNCATNWSRSLKIPPSVSPMSTVKYKYSSNTQHTWSNLDAGIVAPFTVHCSMECGGHEFLQVYIWLYFR